MDALECNPFASQKEERGTHMRGLSCKAQTAKCGSDLWRTVRSALGRSHFRQLPKPLSHVAPLLFHDLCQPVSLVDQGMQIACVIS